MIKFKEIVLKSLSEIEDKIKNRDEIIQLQKEQLSDLKKEY